MHIMVKKKTLPKTLERHLYDLHLLNESKPKQQKLLLEGAPDSLVKAICQGCKVVLDGEVPVSAEQLEKLKQHKHHVRRLAGKGKIRDKRKILVQRGGFLGALLGPLVGPILGGIVPAIGGLLGGIFQPKK